MIFNFFLFSSLSFLMHNPTVDRTETSALDHPDVLSLKCESHGWWPYMSATTRHQGLRQMVLLDYRYDFSNLTLLSRFWSFFLWLPQGGLSLQYLFWLLRPQ
jgi:hypothetical protein